MGYFPNSSQYGPKKWKIHESYIKLWMCVCLIIMVGGHGFLVVQSRSVMTSKNFALTSLAKIYSPSSLKLLSLVENWDFMCFVMFPGVSVSLIW